MKALYCPERNEVVDETGILILGKSYNVLSHRMLLNTHDYELVMTISDRVEIFNDHLELALAHNTKGFTGFSVINSEVYLGPYKCEDIGIDVKGINVLAPEYVDVSVIGTPIGQKVVSKTSYVEVTVWIDKYNKGDL